MTTAYSTLMGLALPVQGELSGTWGDTVNKGITDYVDIALAGTQTISGSQTAVTLSLTNGDASATNIAQAGSGATGTAQFAIINCTGNPAGLLTVTVPASSRQYIVINATSTSQSVKIVGAGPTTGVTIVSGERAHIAWNGSDYVKVASSLVSQLSGTLGVANGGTGLTSGTSGGVLAFTASGTIVSSSALAANSLVIGGGAGVAPSTTTTGSGVLTALGNAANATGGFATINGTATLTNKRIDPRVSSTTSTSSITPDISSFDQYAVTAQAATLTINAPIGTPVDGNKLIFRILDNGTSQTLSWNGTYTAIGVTLPTATTLSKMTYVGCIYNAANTRWDVVAVTTQG